MWKKPIAIAILAAGIAASAIAYAGSVDEDSQIDRSNSTTGMEVIGPPEQQFTCPETSTVDCMPTTGDSKPYCEADNRAWIAANCDVQFTD